MAEKGIGSADLRTAIIVHELLGVAMLAVTMIGCYHFPPSKSRLLHKPMASMMNIIPPSVKSKFQGNAMMSNKWTSAYVESSCLRKLIRPVTLPGKIVLTYNIVRALSSRTTLDKVPGFGTSASITALQF
jgi:hypothetical protein